jgi:AcrR family transcriptional regulator
MTAGVRHAPRPYRSSGREAQARRTRGLVLEAATSVFLARGFAAATMPAIASVAGVSVPTVELLFGTKPRLLKAAIDVAIVGDDDVVPVLDRAWTGAAVRARGVEEFFSIVASVVAPAQERSAGLVLAVFEGSSRDAELAELAAQMILQRTTTAGWIIDALSRKVHLRPERTRQDAVETLWVLMDPAVFQRMVKHRGWSVKKYESWFADSARTLLTPDVPTPTRIRARRNTT